MSVEKNLNMILLNRKFLYLKNLKIKSVFNNYSNIKYNDQVLISFVKLYEFLFLQKPALLFRDNYNFEAQENFKSCIIFLDLNKFRMFDCIGRLYYLLLDLNIFNDYDFFNSFDFLVDMELNMVRVSFNFKVFKNLFDMYTYFDELTYQTNLSDKKLDFYFFFDRRLLNFDFFIKDLISSFSLKKYINLRFINKKL